MPEEKYLHFVELEAEEDSGFFDQLLGDDEKAQVPVLQDTPRVDETDKTVVLYEGPFNTELFGSCMPK